jgi:hypothetical protein
MPPPTRPRPADDSHFDKYDEVDRQKKHYRNVAIPAGTFDAF